MHHSYNYELLHSFIKLQLRWLFQFRPAESIFIKIVSSLRCLKPDSMKILQLDALQHFNALSGVMDILEFGSTVDFVSFICLAELWCCQGLIPLVVDGLTVCYPQRFHVYLDPHDLIIGQLIPFSSFYT